MFSFRLALQKQQPILRKGLYALIILILGLSLQPPIAVQASSTIFNDDFENGFSNWVMSGLWNPESEGDLCGALHAPFPSPTNTAYFGNDSTCTYNAGWLNVGNLTMASQVSLPPPEEGRTARLTFWSFGNTNTSGFSTLRMILISTDGGRNWNYLGLDQTEDAWNQHIFNLTPYLGNDVMIRFVFFSLDFFSDSNKFGWMIDNVSITKSDPPVAQDDVYVTDEDSLLFVAAPGVLSNDTDPDGDSVSVTASDPVSANGASVTVNPDGSFSYDPRSVAAFQALPEGSALEDTFKYTVSYGSARSSQATVHITVNGRNDPPVLQPVSNQTIAEETQLAFTAFATDIDSTVLTYSLGANAPIGSTIDSTSGQFSWTPGEAQGPGIYPITVRVTDNGSPALDVNQTLTVTVTEVNLPPSLASISDQTVGEGNPLIFQATASDPDLPANTLIFSLEAGAPDGATVDPASGQFSWTPGETQGPGIFPITMRVTDNGFPALDTTRSFTITVDEVNLPPSLSHIPDQTVDEGNLLSFTATASDPDIPANSLTFSLEDGAPAGATIDPTSGLFYWTPSEAQGPGIYPITVRVTDNGSPALDVNQTHTVTVTEVNLPPSLASIPDQTVGEGNPLIFQAAASDPDLPANTLTFSLEAGAPDGATVNPASGQFSWTPGETQGPGIFPITMRVTDNGFPALDTTRSFTITVDEVNLPPSLASIPDQTVGESNPLIFQATASDPDFPANSLTFSLDYGAPAGATIDPTSGLFSWTPSEAHGPGIYPITVRVTDNGSPVLNTIQTFTVTVNEVNQPPVINAGPDQTVSEGQTVAFTGSFTDPDVPPPPNGFTIQWNFGDGATAQASLTAIHAYGDNGVYTVTLTLGDGAGGVSTDTLKVTVINVAPIVEAGDDKTSFTDQPGRFSGSFTDPGTLDTHQIVWTFGDGGASTGTLTPSHSFKSPGVYTVTLTVTDKDGAVGSDSLVVTVQQSTYSIYMPVMYSTGKPDLVGNFSLSPQKTTYEAGEPVQITVVVTNQGNGPTGSFWADSYINPSHPPTGFNQTWDELCSLTPCFGITWYVEGGLNPGESLTLTSTLGIYSEEHSYWLGWLASGASDLYLVVDSWNSTGSTGMVQERDETNNVTELHGLQVTGPNPPLGGPSPGIPSLPRRLQPDNQY